MGSTSIWVPPPPERSRNWQDLPVNLTELILQRVGAFDKLLYARKVCKTWREICSDPAMWRVVNLWYKDDPNNIKFNVDYITRQAVELSCGQMIEFRSNCFVDDHLLEFISKSSSQLRCLNLAYPHSHIRDEGLSKMFKKLPLLDELHLYSIHLFERVIEAIGRCCPLLKTFRLNYRGTTDLFFKYDENALAFAKSMPGLRHLQLFGSRITRDGLLAILDNCPHLESLDIRCCFGATNLGPDLVRRLSQQMSYLRLPYDSTEDCFSNDDPFEQSDIDFIFDDYDYYTEDCEDNEYYGGSDTDSF